jgi:hypothetical protein
MATNHNNYNDNANSNYDHNCENNYDRVPMVTKVTMIAIITRTMMATLRQRFTQL